ncbi:MAG TPA: OsmC family protein [Wenzhouxiangella sp.]|nr:OsmC family protein [Wenzhouxiangella sp.]
MSTRTATHSEDHSGQPQAAAREQAPADSRWLKRISVNSEWKGGMLATHRVRRFAFDTAEPPAVGGDDSAPTPMEYVVGALAGCIAVVTETVANERKLGVHGLHVDIEATMDTRGFLGLADVSPHFHRVDIRVSCRLSDAAQLAWLRAETERRCPAYNLVRDAGAQVSVHWLTGGDAS